MKNISCNKSWPNLCENDGFSFCVKVIFDLYSNGRGPSFIKNGRSQTEKGAWSQKILLPLARSAPI